MYYYLFRELQAYLSENTDKNLTVTKEEVLRAQMEENMAEKKDYIYYGESYRWSGDTLRG